MLEGMLASSASTLKVYMFIKIDSNCWRPRGLSSSGMDIECEMCTVSTNHLHVDVGVCVCMRIYAATLPLTRSLNNWLNKLHSLPVSIYCSELHL